MFILFFKQHEAKIKTVSENLREVEFKKQSLEDKLDILNEQLEQVNSQGEAETRHIDFRRRANCLFVVCHGLAVDSTGLELRAQIHRAASHKNLLCMKFLPSYKKTRLPTKFPRDFQNKQTAEYQ